MSENFRAWSSSHPWVLGDLRLHRAALQATEARALESYPSEACGFLCGPREEPRRLERFIPEVNEADKYHALDPERFPRTSRTYFKINELRAQRLFDEGEAQGQPIKVIFHSHCDSSAHFSAEDAATFVQGGELMWPCAFLVLSVGPEGLEERRLWRYEPSEGRFVESPLEIVDE